MSLRSQVQRLDKLIRARHGETVVEPVPDADKSGLREAYLSLLPLAVRRVVLVTIQATKVRAGQATFCQLPNEFLMAYQPPAAAVAVYHDWVRRSSELKPLLQDHAAALMRYGRESATGQEHPSMPRVRVADLPPAVREAVTTWDEQATAIGPVEQGIASYSPSPAKP